MKNLFLYKYNVLLTYTPRKETNLEKYEKWLIDVDNPFFNSINEVSHYSNWKVLNRLDNFDFEYFDFFLLMLIYKDRVNQEFFFLIKQLSL